MKRKLELTFDLNKEDFTLDIRDPETGFHTVFPFSYEVFDLTLFSMTAGEELYSWLSLWRDMMEED